MRVASAVPSGDSWTVTREKGCVESSAIDVLHWLSPAMIARETLAPENEGMWAV